MTDGAGVINGIAKGGAIVAMSAAAVTMLVQSFIAPQLTMLSDASNALIKDRDYRVERDQIELAKLVDERKMRTEAELSALEKAVEELKERVGWNATVHKQRGS